MRFFFWILLLTFGMIFSKAASCAEGDAAGYDARGKRDPFVPLVSFTAKQSSGLIGVEGIDDVRIEGIVYDKKMGSVVIVNGAVLKEGEELGNVQVVEIREDGATFLINGTHVFKAMYQEEQAGMGAT